MSSSNDSNTKQQQKPRDLAQEVKTLRTHLLEASNIIASNLPEDHLTKSHLRTSTNTNPSMQQQKIARLMGDQPQERTPKRMKAVSQLRKLFRQVEDEVAEFGNKIARKLEGQGKEGGGEKATAIGPIKELRGGRFV